MKPLSIVYIIILILCIVGCRNSHKIESHNVDETIDISSVKDIQIDLDKNTNVAITDFVVPHKYVSLKTNKNNLIGKIDRLIIKNDVIYILDSETTKKLSAFTINGSFLFAIKCKGRGPSEMSNVSDFAINEEKKHIIILNNSNNEIGYYSMKDGSFIGKSKTEFSANNVGVDKNNVDWFSNLPYSLYGKNKNLAYKLFCNNLFNKRFEGVYAQNSYLDNLLHTCSSLDLYYNNNELNYIDHYRDKIITLEKGHLKLRYQFDFMKYSISNISYDIDHLKFEEIIKDKAVGFHSFCELDSVLMFSIRLNNNVFFCVYDLRKNEPLYLQPGLTINPADASKRGILDFEMAKTTYNNQFVCVVQPFLMKYKINYLKKNNLWEETLQKNSFIKELENISENDNPMLLFYSINNENYQL